MSDSLWMDITTEDADALADFYVNVMGWKKKPSIWAATTIM